MEPHLLPREDLFELESNLQAESDVILDELDIIQTLGKYGQVQIVGAKRMGLMVKKDIDINCVIDNVNTDIWLAVCSDFLRTKHIRRLTPITRSEQVLSQLTDAKRDLIIRIKYYVKDVLQRAFGPARIESSIIYDAVLNEGITSFEEFLAKKL